MEKILSKDLLEQAVESCEMKNHKIIKGNCWVAYFDILGFKKLLEEETKKSSLDVFFQIDYLDILWKLKEKEQYWPDIVFVHWFSDTFIFYTIDGSPKSLSCIETSATHFFVDVISANSAAMALRGALGFGEFYADKEKGIYGGPAFIDAYQYAEKQHWIGLVISPNARVALQKINRCPPDRGKYREYDVPIKTKEKNIKSEVVIKIETEKLFSCEMQKYGHDVEKSIKEMQREAKTKLDRSEYDKVKAIYENTLKFIRYTKC
jgi:hypothetical protein